jgi:hypothetical protein
MEINERMCEGVYWIHLAQDRVWWQVLFVMVMNLGVLSKASNFLTT